MKRFHRLSDTTFDLEPFVLSKVLKWVLTSTQSTSLIFLTFPSIGMRKLIRYCRYVVIYWDTLTQKSMSTFQLFCFLSFNHLVKLVTHIVWWCVVWFVWSWGPLQAFAIWQAADLILVLDIFLRPGSLTRNEWSLIKKLLGIVWLQQLAISH